MSAIGKGDYVECVDASRADSGWPCPLTRGAIYRVAGLTKAEYSDAPAVWFEEIYGVWRANRFRPIYRPKSEIIESLKQPAPAGVRELEDA